MKSLIITTVFIVFLKSSVFSQVTLSSILSGDKIWDLGVPEYVNLLPGFEYTPQSDNYFKAHIINETMSFQLLSPDISNIKQYEKVEIGLKLPSYLESLIQQFRSEPYFSSGLNPYDPDNIDLFAVFTKIGGRSQRVDGFFYVDFERVEDCGGNNHYPCWREIPTEYKWRIRFAPPSVGNWSVSFYLNVNNSQEPLYSIENAIQFYCGESDNKGYLYANGQDFKFNKTQEIFRPIGINTEWGIMYDNLHAYNNYKTYFDAIHENGGNLASFTLIHHLGLQFEWETLGVYENPDATVCDLPELPGRLNCSNRQAHAWEIDNVINYAYDMGIYLKYTILQHPELRAGDYWSINEYSYNNPYKHITGDSSTPIDFINNQVAREMFSRKLRYMIARWGYSTQIAWWELLTEIDAIDGFEGHEAEVRDWFDVMSEKIKNLDYSRHMISGSYANCFNKPDNIFGGDDWDLNSDDKDRTDNWIWRGNNCDFINLHSYPLAKRQNFERYIDIDRIRNKYSLNDKPFIFGEMGTCNEVENATDVQFHNNIWASQFMGTAGSGLNWYWDNMTQNGYFKSFKALYDFNSLVDYNKNFEPRRFPKNWILPSQNPTPIYWWIDYLVESFYLRENNGNSAIGWFNNATHYWYNLGLPTMHNDLGNEIILRHEIFHFEDDKYDEPTIAPDDQLKISGLKMLKRYDLTPFQINSESLTQHATVTKWANILGEYKISTFPYLVLNYDYAFTLNRYNQKDSYSSFETDTVGCQNDTLFFEGIYENDTLGILAYQWDFGNGTVSGVVHPKIVYNTPGSYQVKLIVTDSINLFSDTLEQTIVVLDCDTTRQLKDLFSNNSFFKISNNPGEDSGVYLLFPNPSSGKFYLTGSHQGALLISIINELGNEMLRKNINFDGKYDFDIGFCPNGFYSIVITDNEGIQVYKLLLIK